MDSQEEKIRQRRDRVEKWRKEKEEARLREKEQSDLAAPEAVSTKVWSLEDDEDDEELPIGQETSGIFCFKCFLISFKINPNPPKSK